MWAELCFFKPMRNLRHYLAALFLFAPALSVGVDAATTISTSSNITVTADSSGAYSVKLQDPEWLFAGDIGRPLADITINCGTDNIGDYDEIDFNYTVDAPAAGANLQATSRQAGIRAYHKKPIVLFVAQYLDDASNTAPFPQLTTYPQGLFHLTYRGIFGHYDFNQFGADSPWLFFDSDANAFILSPASDFMEASTAFGTSGEISSGIDTRIASLPAGLTHRTFLVVGKGINKTFETWGQAMTDLQGKTRPANDADLPLTSLGYWTDNGATYYYYFEPTLGYEETLLAVRDDFAQQGIPLRYMQLDSWFYPKGARADWSDRSGGIYQYVADLALFPRGLADFQQRLGLPLFTHARWIDANSPYRQQYQMSGNVSIDPQYWDDVISYIQSAGVVTYEQDWLGAQAQTAFNLNDPDAFMDNMARATSENGLTMQYCMALPRHYLQTSRYNNITNMRTSDDRFNRNKWDAFLYASRLAGALGVWPWSDVFTSSEMGNLLLSTLSAGPVGVGDPIGSLNKANLLRVVRNDGVIVKPDVPIVPLDESFFNDAQNLNRPMVASTYTDFGAVKVFYIFAYDRGPDTIAAFTPVFLGLVGSVYVYNYFTGGGTLMDAGDTFSESVDSGPAYYIVVPIGPSGIGFLGDAEQFVSLGHKRISGLTDTGILEATVVFADGEYSRTVRGYSPSQPRVTAAKGVVDSVTYDPSTQLFAVVISPDADGNAIIDINIREENSR